MSRATPPPRPIRAVVRWAVLTAILAAPASPARILAAEPGPAPPTPPGCDEAPHVGEIRVDGRQVFDVTNPRVARAPYTWVNAVHIDTIEPVIRREILLAEGDLVDDALLQETERNIRSLGFLRNVSIEKVPRGCGVVDLVVHLQETWTLEPQFNVSGGGGIVRGSAGVVERNLLGRGKLAKVFYRRQTDRDSVELTYADPRLLGTRWDGTAHYADRTDGRRVFGALDHPFFSLGTRFAGGGLADSEEDLARMFEDEVEIHTYERESVRGQVWGGMRLGRQDGLDPVDRILVSYSYSRTDFGHDLRYADPSAPVPANRRFSTLWLGAQRIVPDYIVRDHIERFDRQEDFNLGNELSAWVGFSPEVMGSRRDAWHLTLADGLGFAGGDEHLLLLSARLSGRLEGGEVRNALQGATARYYYTGLRRQTLFAQVFEQYGWSFDEDRQLLLGGDNGLRGYPIRFLEGDKRILATVEDRVFLWENVLDLVSLGLALFFDTGTAAHSGSGFALDNFRSDVGIGLRIAVPASAFGELIRIDLAYALDDTEGANRWMISFGQGQSPALITREE